MDQVFNSRRHEPMLFPSLYFSDGMARGDFHTGSNVAAWFAFKGMARIASEAYGEKRLSSEWSSIATEIHEAVNAYCTAEGPTGRRFFEGANADGSFIPGHDGEESETLMSFYGFCASDDPRLLNHAGLAMTTQNPLYSPELDAIWWFNDKWSSATMPGWTTALAEALTQQEIQERLQRIRQLTDLDGSLWWWPYRYGSKDRTTVIRADVARKCGWGAAVYLCRFVHDLLGLSVDASCRTVHFSPFIPWNEFAWKNARLGTTKFDITFTSNDRETVANLVNRNQQKYKVTITLTPQKGRTLSRCRVSGVSQRQQTFTKSWGSLALETTFDLQPGQSARVAAT